MPAITFSGLATGLDTASIISGLVGVERGRADSARTQKFEAEARLSVVRDLSSMLGELSSKAEGLDEQTEITTLAVDSSNEAVGVTLGEGGVSGTYDLDVINLARAEVSRSSAFTEDAAGVFTGAGTLGITVGADTEITVDYDATDSLTDVAAAINDSDARVNASVLFDGTDYYLTVTAQDSGLDNAISFTDTSGETGLTDVAAEVVAAEDAQFTLNGMNVTRASNVVTDAIAGVTLELMSESQTAQITVSNDTEALRERMQEYVDAFNDAAGLVDRQLDRPAEGQGPRTLFGDSTTQGLQRALSDLTAASYGTGSTRLATLGIELQQSGKLEIDADAFDAAVAADPDLILDLLEGPDGFSQAVTDLVDTYTDGSESLLGVKEDSIEDLVDRYDTRIERMEDSALALEDRLTNQFANLEQLMSDLQAQQAAMASLFTGLF